MTLRNVAVVGFAQAPIVAHDPHRMASEMLYPVVREALAQCGVERDAIDYQTAGSADYIDGRPFGFVGALSLLVLYGLIIFFCVASAMTMRDRYSALLTYGVAATFFLYFAVNMSMVMGLAPVVGVPLPLVSYGGSAMLVLLAAFGLVQSAYVHRPRGR